MGGAGWNGMETGLLYRWWSSSVSVDEGSEAANQPSLPLHDLGGSEEEDMKT